MGSSNNDLLRELMGRAGAVASAVVEFSKEMAFELRTEAREAARTGFGLPRALTSAASLGCFAVAAAGTASITMDFVKKVYGARECEGCNGWEALTCRACIGFGRSGDGAGGQCPTCSGTGIVKCGICNGNSWKPKFTMDRILDSPVQGWNAYSKCLPVGGDVHQQAVQALVEQTVAALPVPPRPKDWAHENWQQSLEKEAEAAAKAPSGAGAPGVETVRRAKAVQDSLLDAAWAAQWREEQVQEMYSEMNASLAKVRKQTKQPSKATGTAPASQP